MDPTLQIEALTEERNHYKRLYENAQRLLKENNIEEDNSVVKELKRVMDIVGRSPF